MNNRKPTDLVSGRLNGARRADGPSRANYGRDRLGIAPESEQAPPPPAAPAKANAPSLEEILQGTAPTSHHADRLEFRAAGDGPSPFRPKPAPPVRARPAPAAPRRQPPQGPKIRRGVWVAAIAGALLIILLAWILSPDRELAPSPAQAGAMTRQIAPAPADPQTDEQARESSADAQPAFDRWAASHAIEDAWSSLHPTADASPPAPSVPPPAPTVTEFVPPAPAPAEPPPAAPPAPEKAKTPVNPQDYALTGIIRRAEGPLANINGRFVPVGGTVDGAKVLAVQDFSVELEKDGQRFSVGFHVAAPESDPASDSSAATQPVGDE